jgi:CBS domain-containing protein
MKARDIMTTTVVSVGPEAPTHEVAKVLGAHGISAVPVVDAAGANFLPLTRSCSWQTAPHLRRSRRRYPIENWR